MGLKKKLLSAILAASLVLGLVGTAAADFTPGGVDAAAKRMQALGIVKGVDASGDLGLNMPLTRAQVVTVLVRAFGQEENAKLLMGAPTYTDVAATHWASGYIALAKNMIEKQGLTMGVTATTFNPDGDLTTAEALAFTMKFLGVKPAAGKSWPMDFMQGAADAGLISADELVSLGAIANTKANRGLAFYLSDKAFAGYKLPSGKTMYQTFVDTTPPTLTVDEVTASTDAASVTLTGKVTGQRVLHVGTTANVVTPELDGSWSATLDLKVGANDIWVHALDIVGNAAETTVSITRVPGAAASVEVSLGSQLLKAGAETELVVAVKDANGTVIEGADVQVSYEGEIGAYADGKFTAATKPATGKVIFTSGDVVGSAEVVVTAGDLAKLAIEPANVSLPVGQAQKFTAKGTDMYENEVEVSGVTWSASGGVMDASGNFAATAGGKVTITATAGTSVGTSEVTAFAAASKLSGSALPEMVANATDTYDVVVNVQDASGTTAANSAAAVTFTVNGGGLTIDGATSKTVTAVNGVATVSVKTNTTAVATGLLTVTSPSLTGLNLTYKTVTQALTSAQLSASPSLVGNDGASKTTVSLKLLDQKGVALATTPAGLQVKLTSSATDIVNFGGAATFTMDGSTDTIETAAYSAVATANNNLGAATISATVTAPTTLTSVAVSSTTVSTGLLGAPYQLSIDPITEKKAGEAQSIKVRIKDVNGNQITNPAQLTNVTLKAGDVVVNTLTSTGTTPGEITFSNTLSTSGAITYTAEGTWAGVTMTKATATGNALPGAASSVTVAFDAPTLNANGAHSTMLKATIKDASTNVVTAGSYDVTFEKTTNGSATAAFTKTTVKSIDGVASVTVTAGTTHNVNDIYTVTVKISDTQTLVNTATVTSKVMGVPNKLANQTQSGSLVVGKGTVFQADVQDGNNVQVTTDNGRAFTLTLKDGTGAVVGTYAGTTANGVAKVTVSDITKAQAVTPEFTSDGLTKVTGAPVTLLADAASTITLSSDLGTLGNDGATAATVTVKTADKYGNASAVGAPLTVAIANSNTGLGTVTGLTGGNVTVASGTSSITFAFQGGTGVGSTTFTGSATGYTSGTASVNVVYVSAGNKLFVNAIDSVKSGSTLAFKVDVQDYQGIRVTNYNITTTTFTVKVDSVTVTPTLIVADRGQATITLAASAVQTAGSHAVSVEYTGLAAGTGSFSTTPGAFASVTLNFARAASTTGTIYAGNSDTDAVTIKVADAANNALTDANGTATVTIVSGNDYATLLSSSVTIANGSGVFLVQSKALAGAASIKASLTYNDATVSGTSTLNVVPYYASSSLSTAVTASTTTFTLTAKDSNNQAITNLVASDITMSAGYTVSSIVHNGSGQYTVTFSDTSVVTGTHTVAVTVRGTTLTTTMSLTK